MKRLGACAGLLFAIAACSSGPSQGDVVSGIAVDIIVPSLQVAHADLDALADQVADYCQAPETSDQSLVLAAWEKAVSSWEAVEATAPFGPASMLRTVSMTNYLPISEVGIDDLLAGDEAIDPDYLANRSSSTRRGLGAIEYTLLGSSPGDRKCEHAVAAAAVAAIASDDLVEAWTVSYRGGAAYSQVLTEEMEPGDALGDIIGAIVETFKRQSRFEVGRAIGVSAPEPDLEAIPEGHAGFGSGRYLAQLAGIEAVLQAGGESSLIDLIRSRSEDIADSVESHLEDARAQMLAVEQPLRTVAVESPEQLQRYLDEIDALLALFEADVVSLLDVTLGFSDSDGDTG